MLLGRWHFEELVLEGWVGLCWPLGLAGWVGGPAPIFAWGAIMGADADRLTTDLDLGRGVHSLPL